MLFLLGLLSLFLGCLPLVSYAQSSCTQLSPSGSIRPSLASGYQMQVVATGLSDPRSVYLNGAGQLLVVEAGRGTISSHTINEDSGCVTLADATDVVGSSDVGQLPIQVELC